MSWLRRQYLRNYVTNSTWLIPTVGMAIGLILVQIVHWVETRWGWESTFEPDAARSVLSTLASSMFTFIVFVSSALLIVFQLASVQLSPRIIGIVFRDPIVKASLTMFVFTFTVTLSTLVRIGTTIPLLSANGARFCCIASIVVFLHLIDHVAKSLRPSGALRSVGRIGRTVIESVYPRLQAEQRPEPAYTPPAEWSKEPQLTVLSSKGGAVLAFDLHGLTALARSADCTIELWPQVGSFVAPGDPLFRVAPSRRRVTEEVLRHSVAIGQERSVEQDPLFVFRILVDIAAKALSPAINDPTTAVLALDQIHHLLRVVGVRDLDEGRLFNGEGKLRLVFRTPDWEDFVRLAVSEIRLFGGGSLQIVRRLRAMLENLIEVLPESRGAVLRQELNLLKKTVDREFPEPEDRALADVSDLQGLGGER